MRSSLKIVSVLSLFGLAAFSGAGCAGAADKDKDKGKSDESIRWEAPAAPSSQESAASPTAAAYDAEDDLQSMWEEMNRMHQSMLSSMGGWGWSGTGSARPARTSVYNFSTSEMHADVAETDKEFIITCELPGVPKDRIQIDVDGSVLLVRAVRDSGVERSGDEGGQKYHYRERSYGTTERRFRVGSGVDPKKIKASLKDGVLTLRVPKGDAARKVQIPIEG